jgi:hypothetical protein
MDGRMLQSASRYRRVEAAIRAMDQRLAEVLHAFAYHRELGVMLIQPACAEAHRRSRSRRSLPDWLERIAPHRLQGSSGQVRRVEDGRLWLRIKADAIRELDKAMGEFDMRWRKR